VGAADAGDAHLTVHTDAAGRWSYAVPAAFRNGTSYVIASAADLDGNRVLTRRLVNGLTRIR